jgi:phosphinothricin acetyltransferase
MSELQMHMRAMDRADWPAVSGIYQEGIATGDATFETSAPSWATWDAAHMQRGRIVGAVKEQIIGWAALSPVSDRCAYTGVAEVSVYVAASARGHGAGAQLLAALVAESERAGIWTLQAGVFPENTPSVAIHTRCGFRQVGRRERLGQLAGRWRDVLLLERRSTAIGADAR